MQSQHENFIDLGNQQERSLAWIAGFIDGEGSITVSKQKQTQCNRYYICPTLSICNTHLPSIERCILIFSSVGIRATYSGFKASNSRLMAYKVLVRGRNNLQIAMKLLIPHLFTKKPQAELMLEYLANRYSGDKVFYGVPYSDREVSIFDSIRAMNKRGRSSETLRQDIESCYSMDDKVQLSVKADG